MDRKLSRSVLIWGSVVFTIFLGGCQGQSSRVDLLHFDTPLLGNNPVSAPVVETIQERALLPDPIGNDEEHILGGILTTTINKETLRSIKNPETYTTIVVLASTAHATATHQVFTYDNPGVLGDLAFDRATIQKLRESNIVESLGTVPAESFWNKPFVRDLRSQFPAAQLVLISLNKDLENPEILGYALSSHLPDNSMVFALADFEQNENLLIREFQNNYAREILNTFDETHFQDLPVNETVQLEVLARYLRLRGATHSISSGENQYLFNQKEQMDQPPSTVYLVSFGDIMLGRFVRTLMDSNGLDYPFTRMDNDYLRVNDILLANLEGPITTSAVRTNTGMNFGFFPDVAPILKKYHFDLLSQANNHTLDKRAAGYEESMNFIREQGIIPFGHQQEITDQSVAYRHIRGQKFAFLGLEDVNSPINDEEALAKVRDLVAQGYKVIVYPHWGIEYQNRANDRQRGLAHSWIDAGAYAVIGHHPHVIQNYETYKGRPIFYSLGNAVFDQYWSVPTQEGLSVALAMDEDHTTIYFLPIKIDRSQMRLMNPDEARAQLEKLVQWGDHSEQERQAILSGKLIL